MKVRVGRWWLIFVTLFAFLLIGCNSGSSSGNEGSSTGGGSSSLSTQNEILGACQPDYLMPTVNRPILEVEVNGSDYAAGDLNDFFGECIESFSDVITSVAQLVFVKKRWLEREGYQEIAPGEWYQDVRSYGADITSFVGVTDKPDRWQIFKIIKGKDSSGTPIHLEIHAFVAKDCKSAGANIFIPEYAGGITATFDPGKKGKLIIHIKEDTGGYSGVPGIVMMKQGGVIITYSMDSTWATLSGKSWDNDEKGSGELSIARELNPHKGRCEMVSQYKDVDGSWVTRMSGWIEWWQEGGEFHGKYDVQYLDKHYPPDDGTTGSW